MTAEKHWNQNKPVICSSEIKSYDDCLKKEGKATQPYSSFKIIPKRVKRKSTAIVLFHGLTSTAYTMAPLGLKIARETGLKTYGFTISGHGSRMGIHEQKPGNDTTDLSSATYEHWLEDVKFAIRVAQKDGATKVIVGGHSTGAMLAQYAALDSKLSKSVAGLLLLSPPENKNNLFTIKNLGKVKRAWYSLSQCENRHSVIVADRWRQAFPEFYSEYRGEWKLGHLWVSALDRPKKPSQIQYRSPTVNATCELQKLVTRVKQMRQSTKFKVPVILVVASNDNLIDWKEARKSLKKSTHSWKGAFTSVVLGRVGHAGYLIPRGSEHVKNPKVWYLDRNNKGFNKTAKSMIRFVKNHFGLHEVF